MGDLLATATPTSTVATVGMPATLLFPLQQAVPETTTDEQAGDNHRLLVASLISTTRCLFTNRFSAVSVVSPVWLVQLILS